ncbi:MAG: LPS export ABC transporter permease LptF [Burkholderiales bacterium PBB6]|jgi:lipopolysaccharide export system permease protein|uniref:Lipopolysaccharide export system permease protein LptF n=1 Tax=Ideonella margarita TaxID=2984191 RepID=A0ABU9CCY8_9BURK|nr:MAG: LPS export ABC transporter permease LptF [Burkholderiales bacterium PBB6]
MLFDSTVRKELGRSFGATLVVILTIVLTMMLIRTLGMAASGRVSPQDVVLVLGYTALGHLPTMLALSLFIGVVITLGRMYRDSEMAIWMSSGVGLSRLIRPVLRSVWPVLALIGVLVSVVWPWGNQQTLEMRQRYEQRSDLSRVAPGSFQTSADGSRVFFIEREGETAGVGRNVFVLSNNGKQEAVTTARAGRVEADADQRVLVLDSGHRNEANSATGTETRMSFERFRLTVDAFKAQAAQAPLPKAVNTIDLLRDPTPKHQGELVWRLGSLLGATNLLLLGIGLSASNPRRASNWNLMFALLAFVVYYNLINLSQAWVAAGKTSMGGALIGLHGGALLLALGLIWWRDHAAVLRFAWRRPAKVCP